jgi:hypothetical protein
VLERTNGLTDDGLGGLVLDRKHVGHWHIVALGPEHPPFRRELRRDAQAALNIGNVEVILAAESSSGYVVWRSRNFTAAPNLSSDRWLIDPLRSQLRSSAKQRQDRWSITAEW